MSAAVASVRFGQALYASLLQTGAISAAAQAIISPLSVWFALVLLLSGAGPNTPTQQELWAAVNSNTGFSVASAANFTAAASSLQRALNQQAGKNVQLVIANAIWTRQLEVRKEYAAAMKSLYNAEVQAVSNADPINAWASKVTNGLITLAVPPSIQFNMIITNAVYFKGMWEVPFNKADTRKQPFAALGSDGRSKQIQVDMMSRNFKSRDLKGTSTIRYAAAAGQYRAVRLPYTDSDLSAVFLLPEKSAYASIADAAAKLPGDAMFNFRAWRTLYETGPLSVSVPRFKISVNQLSLTKGLNGMGIKSAFNPRTADFSRISDSQLAVSNVLQSAVVEVDEQGTTAAAVTSVVMVASAAIPREAIPPLVFDRPFLFFLVDDSTKTVLFQGAVTDPSK